MLPIFRDKDYLSNERSACCLVQARQRFLFVIRTRYEVTKLAGIQSMSAGISLIQHKQGEWRVAIMACVGWLQKS